MIHFISDHFIAPLRCGLLFDSSENKVSQAALPILCCLGLIFLGIFPIPGNTVLLAGAVIAAAYCYEPPLGEPFVLPKLRPLFSPPSELLLNIRILRGDPLPEDAPRGIKGGDSWLSADLQLLESSIAIVQWLRDMPPRTLASFGQFFQAYERGDRSLTSSPLRAALSDIFPSIRKGPIRPIFCPLFSSSALENLRDALAKRSFTILLYRAGVPLWKLRKSSFL